MKEFRIFFGILIITLLVMCFTYYSRLMPFLLITVAIVCGLSFFLALFARLGLSVKISEIPSRVERKSEELLRVNIKNQFFVPMTPVRIYVEICEKNIHQTQKKMIITGIAPFSETTLNIPNIASFRGEYFVAVYAVEFFDILKIFRFRINGIRSFDITSTPRRQDIKEIGDDNQDETEASRTRPHGFNKDVFSHLREYREGESLRHIHWKLSARMLDGDLIVKQMEANYDYSALVFCDFTYPGYYETQGSQNSQSSNESKKSKETKSEPKTSIETVLNASDTVIETALAVIRQILMIGNTAEFIAQGLGVTEITDAASFDALTEDLIALPAEPYDGDFTELFDIYQSQLDINRSIYIITAAVGQDLAQMLNALGLVFRRNVTLLVIPSPLNRRSVIEYLKIGTKINVRNIKAETPNSANSDNSDEGAA